MLCSVRAELVLKGYFTRRTAVSKSIQANCGLGYATMWKTARKHLIYHNTLELYLGTVMQHKTERICKLSFLGHYQMLLFSVLISMSDSSHTSHCDSLWRRRWNELQGLLLPGRGTVVSRAERLEHVSLLTHGLDQVTVRHLEITDMVAPV